MIILKTKRNNMHKQKIYYQIEPTIDSKIIGKSELALSVEITNKQFLAFRKDKLVYVDNYFEQTDLYKDFPKNITGKMYQRKKSPIDIMQVMPMCLGLPFIISGKVKEILEKLNINKSEFHLEELSIEGSSEPFYFLFIPMLKNSETIDYSKSLFYSTLQDRFAVFDTYEKYLTEKNNRFKVKNLFLPKVLENRDIISVQAAGPFFSERIIDAFKENQVVGYDIINGGDFKVDLQFS